MQVLWCECLGLELHNMYDRSDPFVHSHPFYLVHYCVCMNGHDWILWIYSIHHFHLHAFLYTLTYLQYPRDLQAPKATMLNHFLPKYFSPFMELSKGVGIGPIDQQHQLLVWDDSSQWGIEKSEKISWVRKPVSSDWVMESYWHYGQN